MAKLTRDETDELMGRLWLHGLRWGLFVGAILGAAGVLWVGL